MSYALSITKNIIPQSDKEAWNYMDTIANANDQDASKEFLELLSSLVKKYPCRSTLIEDEADDCVWSDSPLIKNAHNDVFFIGVVSWHVEEVVPFVISTANKMGLVVFDIQLDQIYRP